MGVYGGRGGYVWVCGKKYSHPGMYYWGKKGIRGRFKGEERVRKEKKGVDS